MSIVKKVNIDELINVLMDLRKNTEFVDMQIQPDNVLKVRKHELEAPKEAPKTDTRPLTDNDLNQLIA